MSLRKRLKRGNQNTTPGHRPQHHFWVGGWQIQDVSATLASGQATVLVLQGLDFFAEVPVLDNQMPPARGVSNAVVILVTRDMQHITSTGIKWLQRYATELQRNGNLLIMADVNPSVLNALRASGAMDVLGEENVFPATTRVLAAEETAWEAAQKWLQGKRP